MSTAISKSAKGKAASVIRMIKNIKNYARKFDDCFEMGEGNEVMEYIIEKAEKDVRLAVSDRE